MRYTYFGEERLEATESGERANCHGCNTDLYSRKQAGSEFEYTWVHYTAGECEYSYDRVDSLSRSSFTVIDREQDITDNTPQMAVEPTDLPISYNNDGLKRLKREFRSDCSFTKAHECAKYAILCKPQSSIPGIVGWLKKTLIECGRATESQLAELNATTTKIFYEAERSRHFS